VERLDRAFEAEHRERAEANDRLWGTKELAADALASGFAPSLATDEPTIEWLADYMRNAASPGVANALARMNLGILVWLERSVRVRGIFRDGRDNIPQLGDSALLEPEDVNRGKLRLSRIYRRD
jgi:hypothetical protein